MAVRPWSGGHRPAGSRPPSPHAPATAAPAPRKSRIKTSFSLGKYLVSPLARRLSDGRWSSAVSIRTGRGSATHDRILRFVPVFDTPHDANAYAACQARGWLGAADAAPA